MPTRPSNQMLEVVMDQDEGKESFEVRRKGVFESIHDALHPAVFGRRCSSKPIANHTPSAIHSAPLKCPGTAGTSFIRINSAETVIPNIAMARNPARYSTKKNETQAANHPSAAAIDPTSVTGTSNESPSNNPISVPAATVKIATVGVRFTGWIFANAGAIVPRRP